MLYTALKALISGVLVAAVSETAKRSPAIGALIASLPIVSILAVVWLWRDTGDTTRIARHLEATFWFVLPSLPMFLAVPALLRTGWSFWAALGAGCVLTTALYLGMAALLPRLGVAL